ncbi:hypothetical protein SteCoe_1533 [Stentor coeruleus]|uniref:Uncharacterized protein n=1 Tax=Stentor coeruleus TaxID=5963 RepID=A0A1R2D1L2_9CILI|nr:hypothetical protein SteCoe_1533 [Stentor coeruleus]
MCKLNILCKQLDGQCDCYQKNTRALEVSQAHSSLLCSILSFIKDQPDIMRSLSESSSIPIDHVLSSFSTIENTFGTVSSPQTQDSSIEISTDLQVNVISDIPSRIFIGKHFSLMAEIVNTNFVKAQLDEPQKFQIVLVGRRDGLEKLVAAEEVTSGVALFRKIVINEEITDCSLVVKIKGRSEITQFSQDVEIKSKKSIGKLLKRFKSEEIPI